MLVGVPSLEMRTLLGEGPHSCGRKGKGHLVEEALGYSNDDGVLLGDFRGRKGWYFLMRCARKRGILSFEVPSFPSRARAHL